MLEHDLVDDAATGLPEAGPVLRAHRLEEVVDLLVVLAGGEQIALAVVAGLDEVVAVRGGGNGDLVEPGRHELQPRHLSGGVLHGHPVGAEVDVALAPLELLVA